LLRLVEPQPDPILNAEPAAWDLVREDLAHQDWTQDMLTLVDLDMLARDQFGLDKYGMRLQPSNGRDNLVDAYQEILDFLVYLRSELFEREGSGKEAVEIRVLYLESLNVALSLRNIIRIRS